MRIILLLAAAAIATVVAGPIVPARARSATSGPQHTGVAAGAIQQGTLTHRKAGANQQEPLTLPPKKLSAKQITRKPSKPQDGIQTNGPRLTGSPAKLPALTGNGPRLTGLAGEATGLR